MRKIKYNIDVLDSLKEFKEAKEYWIDKLSGNAMEIVLKPNFEKELTYIQKRFSTSINKELYDLIVYISKNQDYSIYTIMMVVLKTLLFKYSNQENINICTPIFSDGAKEIENFNRCIILSDNVENEMTFRELLINMSKTVEGAYRNQYYPFEKILKVVGINKEVNLYRIMLSLSSINNNKFIQRIIEEQNNEIAICMKKNNISIDINVLYNSQMFNEADIKIFMNRFIHILKIVTINLDEKIKDVTIISKDEEATLLNDFNRTYAEYAKNKTIQELFEEQVDKTPHGVALTYLDKQLTYLEYNEKANKLAKSLRDKNVKANDIVAIMVDRSFEMLIGIMAILKSGAAYLPISPHYPEQRIQYMLKNSNAKILLTQEKFMDKVVLGYEVINVEDENSYHSNGSNLKIINSSNDLAYVIYTSGSTGQPKGVMIEHYSVVNRINWMNKEYKLENDDVILHKTPFTFDVSVWELFWANIVGAELCILPPDQEKSPEDIVEAIERNNVTIIHFVPSMLNMFLEHIKEGNRLDKLSSLKHVFSSGEALGIKQVNEFNNTINKKFNTMLVNLYGPTEATVDVTFFECDSDKELKIIPIGKPIDNIKLYILDESMNIQPIGILGELYIGGDGLSRGYINNTELTEHKFIVNPFNSKERIYRTGDLAKWLSDGNIEYGGRVDYQVKIRGFRIELGEIENQILKNEFIKEAVVIDRVGKNGDKYLSAYYTASCKINVAELRKSLLAFLPEYMIPTYLIQIDKMPINDNGKADRKLLPEFSRDINNNDEKPKNEIEEKILGLWRKVLDINSISVEDNFFDIGGNSLSVINLASLLSKEFSIDFKVNDVYMYPTIKEIYYKITSDNQYNIIEANKRLLEIFGNKCILKSFKFETKEYIILFTDYEKIEVKQYVETNFNPIINPHYVRRYKNINQIKALEMCILNEFEKEIGLEEEACDNIDKVIEKYIKQHMKKIDKVILSQKTVDEYNFVPRMKRAVISTEIEINNESNINNIYKTIVELINNNPLLRCNIINCDEIYNFVEHDMIDYLDLKYIDLTRYNSELVIKIKEKIRTYSSNALLSNNIINNTLFTFSILKLNDKDYSIIFNCDHNIFDKFSSKVLKRSFYEIYSQVVKNEKVKRYTSNNLSYRHFFKEIIECITPEKVEAYKNDDYFVELYNSINLINDKFKSIERCNRSQPYVFEYTLTENESNWLKPSDVKLATSLWLCIKTCSQVFNQNKIPMRIVRECRKFGYKDYSKIIGDFHCYMPILFDIEKNSKPIECFNHMISKENEYFNDKKIHFGSLAHQYKRDCELVNVVSKINKIGFNYIGEITLEEEDFILKQLNSCSNFNYYAILSYSINNRIILIFFNGIYNKKLIDIRLEI